MRILGTCERHFRSVKVIAVLRLLGEVVVMGDRVGTDMGMGSGSTSCGRGMARVMSLLVVRLADNFTMSHVVLNRLMHFRVIITI